MTNATLALNVTRPAPQPKQATPTVSVPGQDDTSPSKRFDAALDAAHADSRDQHDASQDPAGKHDATSAPAASTADTKDAGQKPDDDADKKDDPAPTADTSIASTMLSLIGVPPAVTGVAAKVLGAIKGDAAATSGAALAGVLPGAAGLPAALAGVLPGTAAGAHAATEGLTGLQDPASSMLGSALTSTAATTATASFATLLAAPGAELTAAKNDASPTDPANASPMPLMHSQGPDTTGSIVQVQATQTATSPQFAQELGEQIAWMGSGDVKEARIKLHPEELGSMDVRVNLDGGKVNIAIMAQHPAAVHAVQQTLSHLDSMLAHHGLSLGQADVGQRQAQQGGDGGGTAAGQGGDADASANANTLATSRVSRGLVDEVA